MRESDPKTALVPVQSTALTKVGAKSLVARGRADLRIKEEAEEWLKKGLELRDQGSYEEAFACFERGIQLDPNHTGLQHMLGVMYANGQGVQQNDTEAAAWYRKAAEQGHAVAQSRLGSMYYFGRGVSRDYAQAEAWYRKAADQGHAPAQFYLGVLYDLGQGVPQDYVQMAVWNRKSAEQGFAEAQYELGIMYRNGQGVPQDDAEVAVWFRKAADQGNSRAQMSLGELYYYGHGVPQDYAEAAVWFRKAAEQGYVGAQNNLGLLYYNGQGVPQDYAQAAVWYRKAAEQGYAGAQNNLGLLCYNGLGVPEDYTEAAVWFRKAANQGHSIAQKNLGVLYHNGEGVPQNYAEAAVWYRKAAENGYEPAEAALVALTSETKYQQLSPEEKNAVLDDLKAVTEQGLPCILLVEDEQSIRDIVVSILLSAGFDCREAATGQIAIDLLRSGVRINLVLSNLLLPEVDGFTLLLHVKHNYPRIPFVFVTAIIDAAVRKEAMRNGADGFLQKPFEGDQLLAIVRSVLAKVDSRTPYR